MSTTASLVDPVVKGKKPRVMPWRRTKVSNTKAKSEEDKGKDLALLYQWLTVYPPY